MFRYVLALLLVFAPDEINDAIARAESRTRTAIQQWKFSPTVDQTGPRCVETEIPIVIKP